MPKKKQTDFLDCPKCSKALLTIIVHARGHYTMHMDGTDCVEQTDDVMDHPEVMECGNCSADTTLFLEQNLYGMKKKDALFLEYITNPTFCPNCGHGDIEGQEVTIDNGMAYQPMSCPDCDSEWEDCYRLEYTRNFIKG